jgi:acetyltransferase-like isoleucine patch superfamily enzyme
MSAILRLLGYYKGEFKRALFRFVFINRLRLKIKVGKSCKIAKDFKFGNSVQIRDYVNIGKNVKFSNGIIVGSYASLSNISVEENSQIEGGVKITGNGNGTIEVGKESYIGTNNVLDWSDNIRIGDYVHIAGPSTSLWTHSSAKQAIAGLPLKDKNPNYRTKAPITIDDNVYIGGNCTIYPGITIGHHSIVAPNSAVSKNVEPYSLVGGVPAKLIKHIDVK